MRRRLKVLLLCHWYEARNASVNKHIETLVQRSRHDVTMLSMLTSIPPDVDLNAYDVIAIHFSLTVGKNNFINPESRERLAKAPGLKVVFIQDEYRHVHNTIAAFRVLGIRALFTCVAQDQIEKVYPECDLPGVRKVTVLTGYVPEELVGTAVPRYIDRPIDVGYRGRDLPAWLGELAQEKWRIGQRFLSDAKAYGLVTDIAWKEEDRIYGQEWIRFMSNCKATLGVESGASVFDFTGEIRQSVESHLEKWPDANFEELREKYFADKEGLIRLNQISPRCFDAACLRTLMILYEGEYSGILEPWRHFVPLRKDHSNMDEVVRTIRDTDLACSIIENAYREIACNPAYAYARLAEIFDSTLDSIVGTESAPSSASPAALPASQEGRFHRTAPATRAAPPTIPPAPRGECVPNRERITASLAAILSRVRDVMCRAYTTTALATMSLIQTRIAPKWRPLAIVALKVPKDVVLAGGRAGWYMLSCAANAVGAIARKLRAVIGLWARYRMIARRTGVPVAALLRTASSDGVAAVIEFGEESVSLSSLEEGVRNVPGLSHGLYWDGERSALVRILKVGASESWEAGKPCTCEELLRILRATPPRSLEWRYEDPWDLLPRPALPTRARLDRLARMFARYPERFIVSFGAIDWIRVRETTGSC